MAAPKTEFFGIAEREEIRSIAREEIASLCGLVLRRVQAPESASDTEWPMYAEDIARIFGEALRDFGGTEAEPGGG